MIMLMSLITLINDHDAHDDDGYGDGDDGNGDDDDDDDDEEEEDDMKGHPVHRRVGPSRAPASQNPVHRRSGFRSLLGQI